MLFRSRMSWRSVDGEVVVTCMHDCEYNCEGKCAYDDNKTEVKQRELHPGDSLMERWAQHTNRLPRHVALAN